MFTALLATVLLQKSIDFDHKGAPIERVVEAMSEAYGEKMSADGTMLHDYIILALRDATAERARELIAEALNASWIKKDDGLILHRNRKQELEDERKDEGYQTRLVLAAQESVEVPDRLIGEKADELIRKVLQNSGATIPYQQVNSMRNTLPGTRALARLVKEIDAKEFVTLPQGSTTAFSLNGGFGTYRLPSKARTILTEFVNDQNGLMARLEARAATADPIWGMGRVSSRAADIRVTVQRFAGSLSLHLEAPLSDSQNSLEFDFDASDSDGIIGVKNWPEGLDEKFVMSELALEKSLLRPPLIYGGVSDAQPSTELLNVYLDHEKHDKLELAVSEVIIQAADLSNRSFVVVPLAYRFDARLSRNTDLSVKEALDVLSSTLCETRVFEDAILVVPTSPHMTRNSRVGRKEFSRSLKAFLDRKRDTLTPLADVVASCDAIWSASILSILGQLSRTVRTTDVGATDLLVFYAKMNDSKRVLAHAGGAVYLLRDLNEEQASTVVNIFGRRVRSFPDNMWMRGSRTDMDAWRAIQDEGRWLRKVRTNDVAVKIQVVRRVTPFFKGHEPNMSIRPQPTSLGRLAHVRAVAQSSGLTVPNSDQVYRIVEEQAILMSVISGGVEVHLASYFVPAIYESDEFVPFDKLPKQFLEQYQKAVEDELARMKDPPN